MHRANAVLRARSRTHYVKDFPGPLSIKSVTAGVVAWKCGSRDRVVDRDSFLVLNAGEPYSMEIDSPAPVSTLCVFFQDGFVESVRASLVANELESEPEPLPFLGGLHARDERILPRMQAIAESRTVGLWLDEQYLLLAHDLVTLQGEMRRRVDLMPARRPSTRAELLRRVRRGQEYLQRQRWRSRSPPESRARPAFPVPLSPRPLFTRAFSRTPHDYRNRLRLERARRLLESSPLTVMEICGAVGFESAASFSTLFRQAFGVPPSALRSAKISKIR